MRANPCFRTPLLVVATALAALAPAAAGAQRGLVAADGSIDRFYTGAETHAILRIPHLAGAEPFTGIVAERARTVSWGLRPDRADATVRVVAPSDTGGTRGSERVRLRP